MKSRFVGYGEGAACTVESLVLQHLCREEEGSWAGWHCEGSPLRALWALLMWDVIFTDLPDVFQVLGSGRLVAPPISLFFSTRKITTKYFYYYYCCCFIFIFVDVFVREGDFFAFLFRERFEEQTNA